MKKNSLLVKWALLIMAMIIVVASFLISTTLGFTSAQDDAAMAPATPSPGPEPTSIPDSNEGAYPVTTVEDAIDRAIFLDAAWTERDEPLTREILADNPEKIVVEKYETWQQASDLYGLGVITDKERASEPVWVVVIKGDVVVNTLHEPVESTGITFVFSQNTGFLLSTINSGISKSK